MRTEPLNVFFFFVIVQKYLLTDEEEVKNVRRSLPFNNTCESNRLFGVLGPPK